MVVAVSPSPAPAYPAVRRSLLVALPLVVAILLLACGRESSRTEQRPQPARLDAPRKLVVFAAASTADAMRRVSAVYKGDFQGEVTVSLASSGSLARQLTAGADADVFVSASKRWMDYVDEQGLLRERRTFLSNELALVAPADSNLSPFPLEPGMPLPPGFKGRLALGDPNHVPAGRYAMEALQWVGWAKPLASRLAPSQSVKAALRVVELGEAGLGIVFRTDALGSKRVKSLAVFPSAAHGPIEYWVGLVRGRSRAAWTLYRFVAEDPRARAEYARLGFKLLDEGKAPPGRALGADRPVAAPKAQP